MTRSFVRNLLKAVPASDWLRDTPIGLACEKILKVRSALDYQLRVRNFTVLFSQHSIRSVFDIGANIGDTSSIYLAAGCSVVAVEPDPANLRRLSSRFLFNQRIQIIPEGVGSSAKPMFLNRYDLNGAYNTFSNARKSCLADPLNSPFGAPVNPTEATPVNMTTLDHLIDKYGLPDYIKIDVEGFELEVLRGLHQPVKAVSFECNLPSFAGDTVESIQLLDSLSERYRYNFWSERHDFILQASSWMNSKEIINLVNSELYSFMEIICIML
jgi:FkbM family methyltransferase